MAGFENIRASDHFIERAESELGHEFADLLRDKEHEIDRMGRVSGEVFAQFGILGGNSDRTGVQMANPHHHAAKSDKRCRCKTKLLGTQQCGNHHIASRFELAVRLHDYA